MSSVSKIDLGFQAESITEPLVIADSSNLIFCFLAVNTKEDGYLHDCGLAIIRTNSCLIHKHGYPNDEAAIAHPLREHGFDGFQISNVQDSYWIKEIEKQNSQLWPDSIYSDRFKHWIFPFKETTLELIAKDIEWEISEEPYEVVRTKMLSWIAENES
jgi:hypothetical protein